jgi:hypothetical protein
MYVRPPFCVAVAARGRCCCVVAVVDACLRDGVISFFGWFESCGLRLR